LKTRRFILFTGLLGSFLLILCSGCKKENQKNKLAPEFIATPESSRIHKSIWLDANTGFICGGEKNSKGFIYKTIDGGANWVKLYSSSSKSLYDIFFVNDTIAYCSGDKLLLLKSKDNGNTWTEVVYNFVPEYFNYVPLRCIFGNYRFLMIIGGENYDNGNALWLENDNLRWVWHFDHEFRTGLNFNTTNYLLCGYGNCYQTNDYGYNYKPTKLEGDYFTSSATINDQLGYACGYNGGIYKTTNAGDSWEKINDENKLIKKRRHLNGMCFIDETHGWVVGEEGFIMQTTDGKNWKELEPIGKSNLLSIVKDKTNKLVISTADGKLIRFAY
jgi:photosystem II stability/assembly factor-like uncharacterized protein